jgi:hypothetical protein
LSTPNAPAAPAPAPAASDAALTLDAAAAEIAVLSDDDERQQPRDPRGRYARQQGEADLSDDMDGDLFEDEAQGEGDEDQDQDQDQPSEFEDEEQAEDEPSFTVTVDGEERTVTQSELLKGYSLGEAAYKRMNEAAQVRKQADDMGRQAATERMAYTQLVATVSQFLESQAPDVRTIEQLMLQDPVEGYRAREIREQIMAKAQEFRGAYEAMSQSALAMEQRALAQEVAAAQKALPQVVPEWKDQARRDAELPEIYNYMVREGFEPDELHRIADARAMKIARKAWLFDRLQARGSLPVAQSGQKPASNGARTQPARSASTPPRSLPPGSRAQPSKSRQAQAIADRARSTGSLEDVAAWIAADS